LELARKFGVPVRKGKVPDVKDLHAALVIDALFGTGLSKPVTGIHARTIEEINSSRAHRKISVDIASGISADTGAAPGAALRADYTVTFGLPKLGHLLYPGAAHTGKLFVEDIGFPRELLNDSALRCELVEKEQIASLLPERPANSYKGDYGHVLVVAGSRGKTGAAFLAARAAFRVGAGLATVGCPEELMGVYQSKALNEMTLPLPSFKGMLAASASGAVLEFMRGRGDVLAIGPGIGATQETSALMSEILKKCAAPAVIDADGLNSIKGNTGLLSRVKAPVIITPHPGEMSRLAGIGTGEILKDPVGTASRFAAVSGVYVVLKGVPTVIADPDGNILINSTGSPAMAKAGMGDVLTGMIAGFLAQGLQPQTAAALGVYSHGLAGEILARKLGLYSLFASDMHEAIPEALDSLRGK
jgi:NAD(P)H-hydrate epimerase